MANKDKATGFAAQFEKLGSDETPPSIPKIDRLDSVESRSDQPKAPTKPRPNRTKPARKRAKDPNERISVGLQLNIEQILFIGEYAEKNRLFKQVAFDQICTLSLDSLKDSTVISSPVRNGPDDYAYYSQKTVRISNRVLDRIDAEAKKRSIDRSLLIRHLIDQQTKAVENGS